MLQLNIYIFYFALLHTKMCFELKIKKHISECSTRSEAIWDFIFFTITVIGNMFVIFVIKDVGVIKFEILKRILFFTKMYKVLCIGYTRLM